MSFAAKYDGVCAHDDCDYGGTISPGDDVEYVDDELVHKACGSRARRQPPLCGKCWQYHQGECP